MTFTIGRGNEIRVAAANALAPPLVGEIFRVDRRRHGGGFWRKMTIDSWAAVDRTEKGAIHLATAA